LETPESYRLEGVSSTSLLKDRATTSAIAQVSFIDMRASIDCVVGVNEAETCSCWGARAKHSTDYTFTALTCILLINGCYKIEITVLLIV
jgi:hypothetical protein